MRARILVCEDDSEVAKALARLLRLEGYDVLVCRNGRTAMARAADWQPAFALIDIALSDVSDYAVVQHIREQAHGARMTLIAVTSYSSAGDIEMARYAGFDWHFTKPADAALLLEVLKDPAQPQPRHPRVSRLR